ncbi:MAG: UDP-N-acetylmuramoyl-L-alanyl-D-glutamate--2,6-diaminopimelate ligase [Phycisphaerales bacterium]|nr:UDP-N-acetylmuramoyl-L-alanyl-D-glutamate--2,6-diaminopimelate ligase [Phycisphaerales bacterium]
MDLAELVANLDVTGDMATDGPPVRICDLTEDSRSVVPGSLFVARQGQFHDGHAYAAQAIDEGAVAILTDRPMDVGVPVIVARDLPRTLAVMAERFFGHPSATLRLCGVTGTNGKTTIAHLVHSILNAEGVRCGLMGTIEIDDGSERSRASLTTAPAIEISRSLALMLESGCEGAVLEASSHALDQERVGALSFDIAVFTNLSRDHMDYHQTMEAYAEAKARLFERLGPEGVAIVNADDPAHERMVRDCRARVVRCTMGEGDHRVRILGESFSGMSLQMTGGFGDIEARVGFIGAHNAMNVLQATCAAHAFGLDASEIRRGLELAPVVPGRLERVDTRADDIRVLVDFAHTDQALSRVLETVRSVMREGRLWVVFGCGGDRDRGKRPLMAQAVEAHADVCVLTSDNPRRERPNAIITDVLEGFRDRTRVEVQVDRDRAIRFAIEEAAPGDVVVIAGKGHETEQIISDGAGGVLTLHFDDREIARGALRDRASS